ncbi:TRAP transporter substrate-binding protein [Kushneria aurantia]|uniref:TRAP transporter substrate-binding protein n=1 Tax=Kushneria aurantia TaxID=504092 RepID=A0ABV6G597_9GAMM|nr:TRAP transporter substrate-binding protein [Kushneria aurantia]
MKNAKDTLIAAVTTATALTLSMPIAHAAVNINVVGTWSSVSLHKDYEAPFWTQTLPQASGGEINVEMTTFDQMGVASGDVFRYLSNGLFDIGITLSDYVVSDAPELEGLDLPMLAVDPALAEQVSQAYFPIIQRAMQRRYNAHALAVAPNTPQVVFCNTPISSMGDLAGKTIRASGRSTAEFLNALGANSTVMAFSEVPGAMERSVIDCAVTGSMSAYNAGWGDVASYVMPLPIGGWDPSITAANGDFWDSLSSDDKQLIEQQTQEVFAAGVWRHIGADAEEGIACLTGNGECSQGEPADLELVATSESDLERAHQILEETVLPAWASRVDDETIELWNENVAPLVGLPVER